MAKTFYIFGFSFLCLVLFGLVLWQGELRGGNEVTSVSEGYHGLSDQPGKWPWHIVYQSHYTTLYVDKAARRLMLYESRPDGAPHFVVSLEADIGKNAGDKQRENDHKTPEGIYFFEKKISPPEISFDLYGNLALTTDYPNPFDKLAGKTGYGIWLHAVPDQVPLTRGSRGCVVVSNKVITSLAEFIQLGKSPFIIVPEGQWEKPEVMIQAQKQFLQWLELWRKKWEAQELDTYFSFYHPNFVGNSSMDLEQWKKHKAKIKQRYTNIKIRVEPRLILRFKDQWVSRFYQTYESDQHRDEGEKVLYLIQSQSNENQFQILKEDWVAESPSKSIDL
ncbi:MAG: L,D-transpeptidase family protein [Bdellovibrionaceae bacterium]|nr:L,D-transpeptidase family protein [Pseudobdellovibrionaceae bacterium]MDW8189566.1 L,D-transpeptidase family protein [Pseudobdellovibrionaceae bacterium]